MYPKVRVKEQHQDDRYAERDPKRSSCSPVKEYMPRAVVPMISVPKGNKDQEFVQNDRARSILRPRAVLSSPDNDRMIGKRNRMEKKQPSLPKNHKLVQSKHALCKIVPSPTQSCIPSQVVTRSPRNTRRKTKQEAGDSNSDPVKTRKGSKEDASDRKSDLKAKKGPAGAVPSGKLNQGTRRPSSVRT